MSCDASSGKPGICKYLACGCIRVCSCSCVKPDEEKYQLDTGCWSPTHCRPWISSWFDNNNVEHHPSIYRREKEITNNKGDGEDGGRRVFPTQAKRTNLLCENVPAPITLPPPSHIVVGHPSLEIYRCQLPRHLLHLLDQIVDSCTEYANTSPTGWLTYLYSLTKQDIALRDVPGMYEASRPITHHIKRTIERLYNVDTIRIDRNQPHVLKYSTEDNSSHTGVELHHDKCDLTASIMLSRSSSYDGGGTFFPDANTTVRLEFGEFLLHPGRLVHSGVDITRGKRLNENGSPMKSAIDDNIKASLATLELARHACTSSVEDEHLSNDEVKSAHLSLNQLIRTAESIRETLSSVAFENEGPDIRGVDPSSLSIPPLVVSVNETEITFDGDIAGNVRDFQNRPSSSNRSNDPTQRLLSIPSPTPSDSVEKEKDPKPSESIGKIHDHTASFFSKGTVHPGDIETGRNRMSRFVKPFQNKDNEKRAWKMTAREAFRAIDVNGDGYLQRAEVIRAIEMMVEHASLDLGGMSSHELAEKMILETDTSGDGLIDMDEFTRMMTDKEAKGLITAKLSAAGKLASNMNMAQLINNVLLANQTKIEGADTWMIHPLSNIHATWDILMALVIVVTIVTLPLALGWDEFTEYFFPYHLGVDVIFFLEVCKNFCTGYIDDSDAIIMDVKLVRRKYVNGFFIFDICSCVPVDMIAGVHSIGGTIGATTLKMLRLFRLAKIFRLFRLSKLFVHVKRVNLFIEEKLQLRISDGVTKLIRLWIGTLILAHWIGCICFLLLRIYDFPPDSWLAIAGLVDARPLTQWGWSFFKALAQMIMIGFETPPITSASCTELSEWCAIEYWITLICLYIGAIFYGILISAISAILQTANKSSQEFDDHLLRIDDYMRSKKLPASMREKMKDYFYLQFSNGKLHKEAEILDFLSPVLRREIKHFTGREICRKVPLLSTPSHSNFAQDISCVIEPAIVFANEVIMRESTTGDEMYFISSGVVEIFASSIKNVAYLAIGDGCYFGDVAVLLGVRRTASAKSKTQCTLYRLRKSSLISLLRDYPAIESKMMDVAQSRKRRLAHRQNPKGVTLAPGDEIDSEDSRTDLFGMDANQILHEKEAEADLAMINSGIKPRRKNSSSTR